MFFGEKYINFIVYKQKDRTAKKHVVGSCVVLSFFEGVENKKALINLSVLLGCTQSRDRTGMEVNPLVFETSASTNSAIWAVGYSGLLNSGAKLRLFFETTKCFCGNF